MPPDAKPELRIVNSKDRKPPPELPPLIFTPGYELYNRPRPKMQWLVEGLIPRGSFFCVNGLGGSYKSWLMTALGISVASGARFIEKFDCPVDVQNSVMFVQLEESEDQAARKYQWLCRGLDLQPQEIQDLLFGQIIGQPFRVDDPRRMDQMKILIDDVQPDLVLWDSARKMKRGDENSSEWADEIAFKIKELQAVYPSAHGITHHWRKKSGDNGLNDPGERGRGSGALRDATDVWLPVEENPGGFLTMTHHKNRDGAKIGAFNYKVRISDGAGLARLEYIGAAEGETATSSAGIGSELHALLQTAPEKEWPMPELITHFHGRYAEQTVRDGTSELVRQGLAQSAIAGRRRYVKLLGTMSIVQAELTSTEARASTATSTVPRNQLPTGDL